MMNMAALPDNLPSVSNARLPEVYANARQALEQCARIDECQDWANKAEAMASYARQANDESMHKMADRIQARAIRRCGELLKEFDGNGNNQFTKGGEGALPTQEDAATTAGLSEHQTKQAIRVANVPKDQFEAAIESDNPPTVSSLAKQGTRKKLVDLGDRKPEEFAEATKLIGLIAHIKRVGDTFDIDLAIRGLSTEDKIGLTTAIIVAEDWLQRVTVKVRRALT